MSLYRKKQVVIEAVQWHPGVEHPGVMGQNPNKWCGCVTIGGPSEPHIHTIHAGQAVVLEDGDWILAESDGVHFYPCKPAVFELTYEAVK